MLQKVPDTELLRVVHRESTDPIRVNESQLRRLIREAKPPPDDPRGEAHIELPPHLPVRIGDHVTGIGVRPHQPRDLHIEPCLLLDLPDRGPGKRVGHLHAAAGQSPEAVVPAPLEQDPALVVAHHS